MSLPIFRGGSPTDLLWQLLVRSVADYAAPSSGERTIEVRLPPGTDDDVVVHVEVRSRTSRR